MTQYRLHRLFHPQSRRCFDVAIDHGFFNEHAFLEGIENIAKAVATIAEAGPDAVQLSIGQARHLQAMPGRFKPSLVLRVDVANVYGTDLPRKLHSRMIDEPVEHARPAAITRALMGVVHDGLSVEAALAMVEA